MTGETIAGEFFHSLQALEELLKRYGIYSAVDKRFYGGEQAFNRNGVRVIPWSSV